MIYEKWWQTTGHHYWSLGNDKPATDDQQRIIYEIQDAISKGYKNIVLRLGVGFGKSAIAKTISNMYESSYILTNNIALQKQYINDYDDVALLMGRGKYKCNEWDENCDRCYMKYIEYTENIPEKLKYLDASPTWEFPKITSDEHWHHYCENTIRKLPMFTCNNCPYKLAIYNARNSDCTVCNYHSLYFNSNVINRFGSRDLIVFDEGHYFEEILCQINKGSLNPKPIYEKYGIDIFEHNIGDNIYSKEYWIIILREIINKIDDEKKRVMGELHGKRNEAYLRQVLHEFENDRKLWEHKMNVLIKGDFAINIPDDHDEVLKLEPIFSKPFNDELLWLGNIRIFMSGTFPPNRILCKWFGIRLSETYFIKKYPDFPVENRPIIKDYVGRVKGGVIDTWQNKQMESKLIELCYKHEYENGVIHCSSDKQVDYVEDLLDNEGFDAIPCYDGALGMSKQELIDMFMEDGGILIGSNIREGLDLKGNLCNFQVLFKVPFLPYPEGSRVYERKWRDPRFYDFHVVSRVEQAYGRGVRSPNDVCPFYVLDGCFEDLLKKHMFSEYFVEAIVDGV